MINIATLFTLIRLVLSPLLLPPLILLFVPTAAWLDHIIVTVIFMLLGLTDFIDGYLARRARKETDFGRQLDPIADKIFILSAILPLVLVGRVHVFVALLILGREFFVLSLREMAVTQGFSLPVIRAGKIKMAAQVLYLMLAILIPTGVERLLPLIKVAELSAVLVTIWSLVSYFRLFFRLLSW